MGNVWAAAELSPTQMDWDQLPGHATSAAIGGKGKIICVGNRGAMFKLEGVDGDGEKRVRWKSLPGAAKSIGVAADGTFWAASPSGYSFRFEEGRWAQMPGYKVAKIDVGSCRSPHEFLCKKQFVPVLTKIIDTIAPPPSNDEASKDKSLLPQVLIELIADYIPFATEHVVALQERGGIHVWEETRWRSLPGSAKDCGIGCDGELWVISHHNQIFRWDRGEDAWRRVNGEAVGISVGDKEHVYARTAQGTVWHWNTEHQQWRQVRDGKRQPLSLCFDFSCGCDGSALRIDDMGSLHIRRLDNSKPRRGSESSTNRYLCPFNR